MAPTRMMTTRLASTRALALGSGTPSSPVSISSDDGVFHSTSKPFKGNTYSLKYRMTRSQITRKSASPPKKKFTLRDYLAEIASIEVTDFQGNKQIFNVHKMILCNFSAYFNALFYGAGAAMIEGKSGLYEFAETTHEAFGTMIEYGYKNEIDENDELSMDSLIHLAILAERVLAPKLHNEVIRQFKQYSEFRPTVKTLCLVFSEEFKDTFIRKFLVEYFALTQTLDITEPELPKALLAEVLLSAKDFLHKKGGRFTIKQLRKFLMDE